MKLKKIVGTLAVGALAAAMAVGGTLAYLTDDEAQANVMTTGKVDIDLIEQQRSNGQDSDLEPFEQGKQLLPIVGSAQGDKDKWGMPIATNYVDKIVHVENKGALLSSEAHVRLLVAIPASIVDVNNAANNYIHWNWGNRVDLKGNGEYNDLDVNDTLKSYSWEWGEKVPIEIDGAKYIVSIANHKGTLAPGASTSAAIAGFYMDNNVDWDDELNSYVLVDGDTEKQIDIPDEVDILVCAQAVQASLNEDATAAFKEAFGDLTEANVAKWFSEVEVPVLASSADELKAALAEGGAVALTESVTLEEESTVIEKDATITLSNDVAISSARAGSTAKTCSTMTITGNVTIDGNGVVENTSAYAITLGQNDAGDSSLVINDGTYKGVITAVNVVKGTLTINGGFFEVGKSSYGSTYLINCIDANYKDGSAEVIIKGGTFVNWNPAASASENPVANFVADGYKVIESTDTEGNVLYTVVAE